MTTRMVLGVMGVLAGCAAETIVGELPAETGTASGTGTSTSTSTSTSASTTTSTVTSASNVTTISGTDGPVPTSDSEDSSSTTDDAVVPMDTAFVIRWGDIPESEGTSDSEVGGDGGSDNDPDALLVLFGFTTARCEDVYDFACGTWDASFLLQPDQQFVGVFDGDEVNATYSELSADADPECGGTGGTLDATISIDAIDDQGITFSFQNADNPFDTDVDLSRPFFAPRC